MSDVGRPSGLTRRRDSSNWYFRQRWPKADRHPGAPAEIWISLNTAVYAEALLRLNDARAVAHQQFKSRPPVDVSGIYSRTVRPTYRVDETFPALEAHHAAPLAKAFFHRARQALDLEAGASAEASDEWRRDYSIELVDRIARLNLADDDATHVDVADAMISVSVKAGVNSAPGSEASQLLATYLRRALVQIETLRLARFNGSFADQIDDALFHHSQHSTSLSPQDQRARVQVKLGQVIDRFKAEVLRVSSVSPKTALKQDALLQCVRSFFGDERVVREIERADCNRFRDVLSKLPPNFSKKGGPDVTLEKLALANAEGQTLAWETQNDYLRMMGDLIGWCVRERIVGDNVAADIAPLTKRESAETQRLPFNLEELQRIFAAPIYTGCVNDERGFAKPGPNIIRRSRYWLPLIALFTGMRMGEILQLTPNHFRQSPAGNPFIVLTPDMKLKTGNAEREVPVHPILVAAGLIEWVESKQGDRSGEPLFPEVHESKHGYRSDVFSKRFATFLKTVDLPDVRREKLCYHSLRHVFKDAINKTDTPEGEMDEIFGWSRGKKTGRRYGSGMSADRLKPYVDQVAYDIDLTHIISHAELRN